MHVQVNFGVALGIFPAIFGVVLGIFTAIFRRDFGHFSQNVSGNFT